ncbi:GP46-like surface antigen, putative, partial [Bodo saltans]
SEGSQSVHCGTVASFIYIILLCTLFSGQFSCFFDIAVKSEMEISSCHTARRWKYDAWVVSVIVLMLALVWNAAAQSTCLCNSQANRETLALFYTATNGTQSWKNKWNVTNTSLCTWYGVSCESSTSYNVAISLVNNGLGGSLPNSLGNIFNVSSFSVAFNVISGTLPPSLSAWGRNLRVFSVASNLNFYGTIPLGMRNWSSLVNFTVTSNRFSGTLSAEFSEWGQAFRFFFVESNSFSGTLPLAYANWTNLTQFACAQNSLSGSIPSAGSFEQWTELILLDVGQNQFVGSLPLGTDAEGLIWPAIQVFRIVTNRFTGLLPEVYSRWTNLTYFNAAVNQLSGTIPSSYANWTQLTTMYLNLNSLSGSLSPGFGAWVNLQYFQVNNNLITGTLPSVYRQWTRIVWFYVSNNAMTGSLPPEYQSWSKVQLFYVQNNSFTGSLSPGYGLWGSSVTTFWANDNRFTGTLSLDYRQWTSMLSFFVSNNAITGSLPPEYRAWTSIQQFYVNNNSIFGVLPPSYGLWGSSITKFCVNDNRFVGTLPLEYGQWTSVEVLYVHNNAITGSLPPEYRAWTSIQQFYVNNNSIFGVLPPSYGLWGSSITKFCVNDNRFVGTLPLEYGQWTSVEVFYVSNNTMTGTLPREYRQWTSVVRFYVANNAVTGTLPPEYRAWKNIEWFRVQNNSISGALPIQYSEWGSALMSFYTVSNALTGTLPTEYSNWTNVNWFRTSLNHLSGTLPPSYGSSWKSVVTLQVFANSLTGTIPTEWGGLSTVVSLLLHANNLSGQVPSSFSNLKQITSLSVAANPNIVGTLPASWGTAWSSRSAPRLQLLWLQNTSITGTIPSSWSRTMFATVAYFSICNTNLCPPTTLAPTLFVMCMPGDLLQTQLFNDGTIASAIAIGSDAQFTTVIDALTSTCPIPSSSTPTPHQQDNTTTAAPAERTTIAPSTNSTFVSPEPLLRDHFFVSNGAKAATFTAPVGTALTTTFGSAAAGLGLYRSAGLMRVLSCGGNISSSADDGAAEDIFPLALGHVIAFVSTVLVAAVVVFTFYRRHSSLTAALVVLQMPGRFGFVAFALGPPLVEFGLALLLSRGGNIGLGIAAFVSGIALLSLVAIVISKVPRNATFTLSMHRTHHELQGGYSWRTAATSYESTRLGEWHPLFNSDADSSFLSRNRALFEDFTGGRHWYATLQCVVAFIISIVAAVADSDALDGSAPSACGAVEVVAGVCNLFTLAALLILRPYSSFSPMMQDIISELLGFVCGILVILVGAGLDTDDGLLADVAGVVLQIQFWLAIAATATLVLKACYLRLCLTA